MNILAIVPALIPSVNIGIIAPLQKLSQDNFVELRVILPHMYNKSKLNNIDLVVFCRNGNINELDMLSDIINKNIKYIYELDDNFFRIPLNAEIGRYYRHPLRIDTLKKFISNASLVRVYSDILRKDVSKLNSNVVKNNIYFDSSLVNNIKKNRKDKIRIVYATSRMADNQQQIFEIALKKIAIKYHNKVEVFFWGAKPSNKELNKLHNVQYLAPIYNYEKFIKAFYKMNFDIGLAPIFEGKFYNSKTNNKYREYGGCGIAGVYSNEKLYTSCVKHECNGLIADNSKNGWYEALERLVLDKNLRENIVKNARKDIRANYSFDSFCNTWEQDIELVAKEKIKESNKKWLLTKKSAFYGVIYDDSSPKSVREFKLNTERMYRGTSVLFNNPFVLNKRDRCSFCNLNYIDFFTHNRNIVIYSNNSDFLEFIEKFVNNHNVVVVSSVDLNVNFPVLDISKYSSYLNEFYTQNAYLKFHELIGNNEVVFEGPKIYFLRHRMFVKRGIDKIINKLIRVKEIITIFRINHLN
jgi:hypothetical protein